MHTKPQQKHPRLQVMFLGVGMIIGAGVFVSTGAAAANLAGPAVVISFVVGGVSSLLSALVYAEFAAEYPIAGGAFNYISLTFGELAAWCARAPRCLPAAGAACMFAARRGVHVWRCLW